MDPEIKRLLEQNLALAKENHQLLKAIRRASWLSFVWKLIVWAAIILAPLYFYQKYLGPIVAQFEGAEGEAAGGKGSGFFGLPTSADLQKLIEQLKAQQQ